MAEQKQQDDNAPKQSARDKIRAATLGNKGQFKTEKKRVNGVDVEVKQPSVGERKELVAAIRDEDGNHDPLELLIWGVIRLTFVPDTGERVFDDEDYDELLQHPTNDWVDQIGEHVDAMLNVAAESGKD